MGYILQLPAMIVNSYRESLGMSTIEVKPSWIERLRMWWTSLWQEEIVELTLPELPERLLFDWKRDYAPLWEPGSTAFWLEPEPGDLEAGKWPLPFVEERPLNAITTGFDNIALFDGVTFEYYVGMKMIAPTKIWVSRHGT